MKLSKHDKYYEINLSTLNTEQSEYLEAAEDFDKKKKKEIKKKNTLSLFRKTQKR